MNSLAQLRLQYKPTLPKILENLTNLSLTPRQHSLALSPELNKIFPNLSNRPVAYNFSINISSSAPAHHSKRVGVVLSGGQAPGGHNVISGLYDALKKLNPESRLYGFLDGPKGIIDNNSIEITEELLSKYRNQGGFDIIGSGRTKIETPEQFQAALNAAQELQLDGLVVIGGDDSNTNAGLLAEFFLSKGSKISVVGVPKTIDGDLKSKDIEISFGFDTASKIYSETIGNLLRDNLSAKKYYYFVKLMGRSASHITLECALRTHPNVAFIAEEVAATKKTLQDLVVELSDLICKRADAGKNYGAILIPEGIVEFIPEFKQLIEELNSILSHDQQMDKLAKKAEKIAFISSKLSRQALNCLHSIPEEIQIQLLMDRDPHGNVQVSQIETEKLFLEMVKIELNKRKQSGAYKGKFAGMTHFCGYEGRSGLPSNFDCQYCYALGHIASLLIDAGVTGYICHVGNLCGSVEDWEIGASNLAHMMHVEKRHGKDKPVIAKALVDLQGKSFAEFKKSREMWALNDDYLQPGPIQFFGPSDITEDVSVSLRLEMT